MGDIWLVQVPEELASELECDGLDVVGSFRGPTEDAVMVLATGANLATLLVARDQVAALLSRLRSWVTRRTGTAEGSEFVLDVSGHRDGAQFTLRLVSRRGATGQAPHIDLAALDSLLHSALTDPGQGTPR